MHDGIPRADIVRARAVLARNGRTFSWATSLLPEGQAARAAILYAFCRHVDDIADHGSREESAIRLEALRAELEHGRSSDPVVSRFSELSEQVGIRSSVIDEFLDGIESDLRPVRVADEGELVRYGYKVAGTVGLMMCHALGVSETKGYPFAIDLGVAMQLTNIARDVLEDAARDRIYLPASHLSPRVTPSALIGGDTAARDEALDAIYGVLDLAHRFYRSADEGMRFLSNRPRLAVLSASRMYEDIGTVIRRRKDSYWESRSYVGAPRKLWLTCRAMGHWLLDPRYRGVARARPHQAQLHSPLRALPGADPAA